MNVKKDLLTVNVTKNGLKQVRGIVVHSMWGTYQGSIAWFKNAAAQASAHYLIAKNGEITQMAEHTTMTWHAGIYDAGKCPEWAMPNPNWYCIGIELEDERNANWQYPEAQRQALRELLASLMTQYSIPQDHVLLHKNLNPSNRSDPVGAFSMAWAVSTGGETMANMYTMPSGKQVDLANMESNKALANLFDEVINRGLWVKKDAVNTDQTQKITELEARIDNAKKALG